ncbi:hypothetical protein DFJ74DRAFT_763224 [Hyaloraphidium curvatum]|nr:hypothetical protein DFJ74DRAFT_763224 [Hyaloraphidium curvatum]
MRFAAHALLAAALAAMFALAAHLPRADGTPVGRTLETRSCAECPLDSYCEYLGDEVRCMNLDLTSNGNVACGGRFAQ